MGTFAANIGPALLLALAGLMPGLLCVSAMENITMGFTMRTLDSRGMQGLLNLLMMICCGNILPLTLFPDSWQKAITVLPYAQMLDAPIRLYTGDALPADAPRMLLIQICWTLLLTALGILFWNRNQRRIEIQGG